MYVCTQLSRNILVIKHFYYQTIITFIYTFVYNLIFFFFGLTESGPGILNTALKRRTQYTLILMINDFI